MKNLLLNRWESENNVVERTESTTEREEQETKKKEIEAKRQEESQNPTFEEILRRAYERSAIKENTKDQTRTR